MNDPSISRYFNETHPFSWKGKHGTKKKTHNSHPSNHQTKNTISLEDDLSQVQWLGSPPFLSHVGRPAIWKRSHNPMFKGTSTITMGQLATETSVLGWSSQEKKKAYGPPPNHPNHLNDSINSYWPRDPDAGLRVDGFPWGWKYVRKAEKLHTSCGFQPIWNKKYSDLIFFPKQIWRLRKLQSIHTFRDLGLKKLDTLKKNIFSSTAFGGNQKKTWYPTSKWIKDSPG